MNTDLRQVFRAYDIRGLSPGELDQEFARRLGHVLEAEFRPQRVLVGLDMRQTSPELEAGLLNGLTSRGVEVTRIGLCSTPMFNATLGLAQGKYDLGVMITASHNPAPYNGFKLVRGDVRPIGQGTGMERLRDRFLSSETWKPEPRRGSVVQDPKALSAYLDKIFSLVEVASLPKMKIAVDTGNGMNGIVLTELAKRLPQVTILPLYFEPDGNFPHHEANPLKTETLRDLQTLVKREGCVCGAAFDGDGDRVGFMDEQAEPIPGDLTTALLAQSLLAQAPGSTILYDLRSSWSVSEAIQAAHGVPVMCRVGHAFIKQQMRAAQGLFAGELSMHFYFRDLWNAESGDLGLLLLLKLMATSGRPLSELWRPLKKYAKTSELNSKVSDKTATLQRIEERFVPFASSVSKLDGLRLEFNVAADGSKGPEAWWFSVRPSNTEPLMRLVVEAVSPEVLAARRDELLALIRDVRHL